MEPAIDSVTEAGFIEAPRDQCAGVTYLPFPELQKLPP